MRDLYVFLWLFLMGVCSLQNIASAQTGSNPIYRDVFTADPAPLVYNDTLWVIVGHDEAYNGEMFLITEWLCYSTTDMVNWTNHGSIMRPEHFNWGGNTVKDAWAAQVVEKNGKFYLYTTCTWGARTVGVAVADHPTGPFVDARGTPLVSGTPGPVDSGWDNIDPTVLIDDDGSAYIAWGNPNCYFAKLKDNMTEIDGEITKITPPNYGEGPWLSKRKGIYYLTYAAFPVPNAGEQICYASAPTIKGPWTYQGILTGQAKNSYTIHPGIVNYKGNDYLFYHYADYTINGVHGTLGLRSVCVEYLCYNDDGTMKPVVQTAAGVTVEPPCPSEQFPLVRFTSPESVSFVSPATISFDVDVSDADGTVGHVDFYSGDELIHRQSTEPYAWEWEDVGAGEYTIRAVAFDNDGNSTEDQIVVRVNPPQAPFGGVPKQIPGLIEFEEYDVGGNGFAYKDDSEGNEGGADFRVDEDVDLEVCSDADGGFNLGWATAGEWLEYTVDVQKSGDYILTVRASCNGDGHTISLATGETMLAENLEVPNTEGWQEWADVVVENVRLDAGEQILRLTIGDADFVNLNYMRFELMAVPHQPIALKKGWNLIGCPFKGSPAVAVALSSVWEQVLCVKDMNGFIETAQPEQFHSLEKLEWGRGYLIKVGDDCELLWEE